MTTAEGRGAASSYEVAATPSAAALPGPPRIPPAARHEIIHLHVADGRCTWVIGVTAPDGVEFTRYLARVPQLRQQLQLRVDPELAEDRLEVVPNRVSADVTASGNRGWWLTLGQPMHDLGLPRGKRVQIELVRRFQI